jgi:MFS superfamily sulfate permease-like transporter
VLKTILICSLTLSIVGTLDTFFSLRTAQALADTKFDPRRELAGQAVGNLLSAIVGGLVVSTSLSLTTANYEAGGRTRISTVTSAIALLAGGLLLPKLILSLPLAVLASILIAASYRLIDRECIETARIAVIARTKTRRLRALRDMGTVLAVLLATVLGQPIMGVLVGFGLSCLIFLIDMSRPVIARQATGAKVRSKRIRSHVEQDCLRRHGDDIKILDLQGALFFGNAYNLTEEMRSIEREARIIILNCRKISNVDHSGLRMLGDMIVRLKRHGKLLAISDDRSKCVEDFSRLQTKGCGWHCFVTVDEALEWAENQILDAHLGKNRLREVTFEQSDLANDMTQTELAALMSNMSIEQFEKGSALCRTGDPSDRIWILTRGAVSVRVSGPDAGTRLAMLGPGCTVGEMGLLTGRSRSADVWADDAVTAYVLTAKKFDEIQHENPKLGQRLLLSIARQLTRRLVETSEELRLVNS